MCTKKDDCIKLSDGSETLRMLSLRGLDFDSEERLKDLQAIFYDFNIQKQNDDLFIFCKENELQARQANLIQAFVSINTI
ncbi:DUF1828 domain-containing protein [Campylobacter sp. VicNov18]|nr:DUF1828 domain-containing protein [Campylobacter bilis]MCC8277567.1 DUF1828 domain-containing protein [Campylobacter bilis]MCC8299176.1 DUF1828 domain-containing protein [Campylobacter bilis]MCC8300476.1 DUF1828 domain-containing protein [Campylobacter bilis]MCC8349502.1 DUF1828 domain-containing protein [Campylobacter bilis]MCC8354819.1 DUF1828 domain-containing protein [Campylobacter bilis]